jgi:hypothetical protein
MIVWRPRLPEWGGPKTKWQGNNKPGMYWKGCAARHERKNGIDPEDARCRFPNCACENDLKQELAERDARRRPEENLHDVAARLSGIERLQHDLEYRLPGSGRPLANTVLTREQAIEVLQQGERNGDGADTRRRGQIP